MTHLRANFALPHLQLPIDYKEHFSLLEFTGQLIRRLFRYVRRKIGLGAFIGKLQRDLAGLFKIPSEGKRLFGAVL
jgi:hypothetical protein